MAWVPAVALLLLVVLLWSERLPASWPRAVLKALLSGGFLFSAWSQVGAPGPFRAWMLPGFALCLCGDVLLASPKRLFFTLGLGAFLLGHVAYAAAFISIAEAPGFVTLTTALASVVMIGVVLRWLWPHLGKLRVPVIAYVTAISVMLCGAAAVAASARWLVAGRALVLVGALAFYVSDLFVARHRFVAPAFVNRAAGLPLYYVGQYLLAHSLGLLQAAP
ncbi:MAG: lysoplasmalogenase [Myxococcaceae bacterium]|nr:lysoplasmalogenase [Myxococcaceae bacterium]